MQHPANEHLLLLGATGGTGQALIQAALQRGYTLTALVRNVEKATALHPASDQLEYVEGDALNAADINKALIKPPVAVISSLGIYHALPGNDQLTVATVNVMEAMHASGISRFICISSLGVGDSRGQGNLMVKLIQKTTLRHTLADKEQQEEMIRSSGLDWTIIRPSRLMNGNGPDKFIYWNDQNPASKLIWSINRSDLAGFTLDCLDEPDSIGKAINITGCAG